MAESEAKPMRAEKRRRQPERADKRSPQGRSVPNSGALAPEFGRVVDGFHEVAYHLLEGVDLVEGPSTGAAPYSESILEEDGGQQDALVVGCELVQCHDRFVGANAALPCLGRADLELGSAGEAFYPAFESSQSGEDLFVRGPVREVVAPVEVADLSRLVDDDDGGQRHAIVVPQAAKAGELPFGVAKQGERELEFPYQPGVMGRRVDADAGDLDPPFLELFKLPGVAGELPVAVRVPVAAVEDEHHRSQLQLAREAPGIILLIRQLEVRDLLPYIQPCHSTLLPWFTRQNANIASPAQA